ncbi:MAG: hypothetical protein ACOC48_01225, partial [Thiohalospira sp.]
MPSRILLALLLALTTTTVAAVTPYAGGGLAGSRVEARGGADGGTASFRTLGVRSGAWRHEAGFMDLANPSIGDRQYRLDGYRYLAGYDLLMGAHWGLTLQAGAWFHRSETADGETRHSATSAVVGAGATFRPRRRIAVR